MAGNATPRQGALWFASKGYPVLPLHSLTEAGGCTCGNAECESPGKHPFAPLAPHGLKDATVDLDVIRGWFAEHYWLSYGIVTDALLVIDVDKKHGGLETWADMCGEPTRGCCIRGRSVPAAAGCTSCSRHPQIRSGKLDGGVDIRGIGGYIVGPHARIRAASGTSGSSNARRKMLSCLSRPIGCSPSSRRDSI